MKKENLYLTLSILIVVSALFGLSTGSFSGLEGPLVLGSTIFIWILHRLRSKELGKEPRKSKNGSNRKVRTNSKFNFVDEVANDLRTTAKNFEDPLQEVFFVLGGIQIRRTTGAQDFFAHAFLQLARNEFAIDFVNLNSRTGKPRRIQKSWSQTIGVTEGRFELYLKDHSCIEFIPLEKKSHLYLSIFWQVFHDALNGDDLLFQNPIESGLGHRLREVANHIIEFRELVGQSGALDLATVPTRVVTDEFFGYGEPKFPEIRDKIERWRLMEKLGGGAFGQVFRVEHADTGDVAAIKIMSPVGADGKKISVVSPQFRQARERFLDEATLSMKVSSPFVVSAVDCGREPWPWILFPIVEGSSIREALAASDDPRTGWWNLAHDLISGLSTIHQEGLLHKDIKPDNMIASDDRFVLLDLGIAEVVGYSELLGFGSVGGTFGFMAPELLMEKEAGKRPGFEIDIFSAGMTLLSVFDGGPQRALSLAQHSYHTDKSNPALLALLDKPLNLEGAPLEARPLLSAMLDFTPENRPTAKKLLSYVAEYVDLESKLELIQKYRMERDNFEFEEETGTDDSNIIEIADTQKSWKRLEDEIYKVLKEVRPRYFVVTLNRENEDGMVYVQAMSGGGGWHVEAMAETFSALPHSNQVKSNFMRLDWTPPSSSEPNYSKSLGGVPHPELVRVLTDAFEFGYGLSPQDINTIEIKCQGTGKY